MPAMPRMSLLLGAFVLVGALAAPVAQAQPAYDSCGAVGRPQKLPEGTGKDLRVTGLCSVTKGKYNYGNVNILSGGELTFADDNIEFWTKGIVIENNGKMIAGSEAKPIVSTITIKLYGADQGTSPGGQGIVCVTDAICGIPATTVWDTNGKSKVPVNGPADDYFYQYGPLSYDGAGDPIGYFGYKSIGVSYGGTLQLFGKKGATYGAVPVSSSGTSWVRLNRSVPATARPRDLDLDRAVDWVAGDKIVLTTTDYLPSHSEELTVQSVTNGGKTVTVVETIQYRHQGIKYDIPNDAVSRLKLTMTDVETRAAVALLSRNIRIVSAGATYGAELPATGPDSYFGGHTVIRAGFKKVQVQGVEFKQLGQGGRIGHYPVHFHMARTVPTDTFFKDNSVNESMTRWYVLHSTHGVLFARNVGWKSIGHGYYIEEGTETDNKFQSNIGIYARPAIDNATVNPRKVPGILAAPFDAAQPENVPFYSDVDHPSVFWIMNGWNDFEYNMAAGAGACGACYWLVPGANSGHSRHMKFEGYASMQAPGVSNGVERAAMTPLRKFVGNYCTSAMNSFNTIGNATACFGVQFEAPFVAGVPNPLAPPWCAQNNPVDGPNAPRACNLPDYEASDDYYPKVDQGGGRFSTKCDQADCSTVPRCSSANLDNCMVTVIDRYTSSFHWAETNFSAIWLRPYWYLFTNSVLTDVQNGGLTFITGGGYTKSDAIQGHWALARKSVFVGTTQPQTGPLANPYASGLSPFNAEAISAKNNPLPTPSPCSGNHCLSANDGISFPISNFAMNQRLFNIYDGPAYQESNAYLDIERRRITDCTQPPEGTQSSGCDSAALPGRVLGLPFYTGTPTTPATNCYMPNAAIGWKQPNGFYYPPAFHSSNLYFANVDIRHYVIQPQFMGDTYITDVAKVRDNYCNFNELAFNNWTDIDRQTELSDDDGSLTGYVKTVSVNLDPFFTAPVEAIECASDNTAKTSPYDYVTTVVYPGCSLTGSCAEPAKDPYWASDCTTSSCGGVPMYRQLLVQGENTAGAIRLAGQDTYQRSSLTPNNGSFYINTQQSEAVQRKSFVHVNVFQPNQNYYLFTLFGKSGITQTYSFYVGKGFVKETDVWAVRTDIAAKKPVFTPVATWPAGWTSDYNPASGVLTVKMALSASLPNFLDQMESGYKNNCQPSTFCQWNDKRTNDKCTCNPDGPFASVCAEKNAAGQDVCAWAQKSLDCPTGGCWGIGFKMGATFDYDPVTSPRPSPACYPKDPNTWNKPLVRAAGGIAGSCPALPDPSPKFCTP